MVTHKKRAYLADCIQWDGSNFEEVRELFPDAENFIDQFITLRGHGWLKTLKIGDWLVVGENLEVKCYSPEIFEIKYERLT
jgi:hypothetical protein